MRIAWFLFNDFPGSVYNNFRLARKHGRCVRGTEGEPFDSVSLQPTLVKADSAMHAEFAVRARDHVVVYARPV